MGFSIIDEIIELEPGRSIRARKTILPDEAYFEDHLPGFPAVPGVLLLEMMNQTAGICLESEDWDRGTPLLSRIESANFRDWVGPASTLDVYAMVELSRQNYAKAVCRVDVGGKRIADSTVLFSFISPSPIKENILKSVYQAFIDKNSSATNSIR